jgi:hypothetical protein
LKERNRIREGEGRRMTAALVHSIEAYAAEINKVHTPKATQTGRETKSWSRPPPGVLKLNCDAAFSEDSKSGGWGWIIRDSDGVVITAGAS